MLNKFPRSPTLVHQLLTYVSARYTSPLIGKRDRTCSCFDVAKLGFYNIIGNVLIDYGPPQSGF